jgi:ABC-2 type transport system ATP-binding protein
MSKAIEVRGLCKRYGEREVVRNVDFHVAWGECVAVLGPNGAGKTTTVEVLEGYRRRDSGTVSVCDADPATAGAAWRAQIGIVLQSSKPSDELTINELVTQFAAYYRNPRPVAEVIDLVGLGAWPKPARWSPTSPRSICRARRWWTRFTR